MPMGSNHPLAMPSGVLPEASPVELVEAAAQAGFDFGGMWMEADQWTDATTSAVKQRLSDTGLELLDIEVAWIKPGPLNPDLIRMIEVGAELGARNVLCVTTDPDRGASRDKLAMLMERGEQCGIRINLEFALFTEVPTIVDACALLGEIASPAAGLLIDSLHWQRSGGTLEEVAAVPREWLSYVQLCDAPPVGPQPPDPQVLLIEATDDRLPMGQGGLPLRPLIDLLPDGLPIAIEERSKALRDAYPDFNERARALARTSRAFFEGCVRLD
jgi:sugar phosphate isomerase/epimerase